MRANSALTKPHPQLFYYGGDQLSRQRAEQQLGTQLLALQVLWWGPEGRSRDVGGAMTRAGVGGVPRARGAALRRGGMLGGRAPDLPWIQWKKQLELLEAKHAMQAEGLRQVRVEPGLRGRAGLVQKSGQRWECPS